MIDASALLFNSDGRLREVPDKPVRRVAAMAHTLANRVMIWETNESQVKVGYVFHVWWNDDNLLIIETKNSVYVAPQAHYDAVARALYGV